MSLTPVVIDLETTGLHPENDAILEIAVVVTNQNLDTQLSFGSRVIRGPDNMETELMNPYVRDMHTENGLIAESKASGRSLASVDEEITEFLKGLGFSPNQVPSRRDLIILGSSCRLDLGMIELQMPGLRDLLHYRMLDISGINEAMKMWTPKSLEVKTRPKNSRFSDEELWAMPEHRALPDVLRTLEQARLIRSIMRGAV